MRVDIAGGMAWWVYRQMYSVMRSTLHPQQTLAIDVSCRMLRIMILLALHTLNTSLEVVAPVAYRAAVVRLVRSHQSLELMDAFFQPLCL